MYISYTLLWDVVWFSRRDKRYKLLATGLAYKFSLIFRAIDLADRFIKSWLLLLFFKRHKRYNFSNRLIISKRNLLNTYFEVLFTTIQDVLRFRSLLTSKDIKRLPKTPKNFQELPEISNDSHKLLESSKDFKRLPKTSRNFQRLPEISKDSHKLLETS